MGKVRTGLVIWVGLRVNRVIIVVITEINNRFNYIQIFIQCKNMHVHKCIVSNYQFKCYYIVA